MREVAVIAFEGISPFHLSVPSLVFGNDELRSEHEPYHVTVCAVRPGTLPTSGGYDIAVSAGLEVLETAHTVVLPSWDIDRPVPDDLLGSIRRAHARGARIVGLCLGAFPVAASGVLDGREAATHWWAADRLAARYPQVAVRADLLWSDHGDVITSAGVAAALDCCLHILSTDLGSLAATAVARRIVLAPHRSGSQAQFIPVPIAPERASDPIEEAMAWARNRLHLAPTLDQWSAAARMSRRTFTRRFRERVGMSPQQWLAMQRLDAARLALEASDDTVETVAQHTGFGSALVLRTHFARAYGVTPRAYRAAFRTAV